MGDIERWTVRRHLGGMAQVTSDRPGSDIAPGSEAEMVLAKDYDVLAEQQRGAVEENAKLRGWILARPDVSGQLVIAALLRKP